MSVTKISSMDAVSLLKECGVKSVTKDTNPDDLGKKLKKFIGAAGDLDLSDKHLKKVYKEIAKAYDDGDTVKVFAGKNGKAKNEEEEEEEDEEEDDDTEDSEDQDDSEEDDEEEDKVDSKKKDKKGSKKGDKKKSSGGGTDKWGARLGSNRAMFNAKISKKPKSIKEIADEAGLENAYFRKHTAALVESGHIKKTDKGYCLAK